MKKGWLYLARLSLASVVVLIVLVTPQGLAGQEGLQNDCKNSAAEAAALELAAGVNANDAARVYAILDPALQASLSEAKFIANFAKERSYPYLTPLYLYLDGLEYSDTGQCLAVYTVAARFPGQKLIEPVQKVGDKYYLRAFVDLIDGSFLHKFTKLSNS